MAEGIIAAARKGGRRLLTEIESKDVLAGAGVPVTAARLATSREQAVQQAHAIGYPVVLKVVSEDIAHKTDVGGVALGLENADAVGAAYDRIIASARSARPDAKIDGVAVQQQARPGTEVIVGMSTDPQFGPVLMFGLGGVLVEVLKDVSFGVAPLQPRDARSMIEGIKGLPLLQGYRGAAPADLGALEQLLLSLSKFVEANPEVEEIDLNPVFAYPDGALAVDARIVLAGEGGAS